MVAFLLACAGSVYGSFRKLPLFPDILLTVHIIHCFSKLFTFEEMAAKGEKMVAKVEEMVANDEGNIAKDANKANTAG